MDVSLLLAPITNAAFLVVEIGGAIFVLVGLLVAINYPKKAALASYQHDLQVKRVLSG